jgi:putative ABC transport system ATP-binding protein
MDGVSMTFSNGGYAARVLDDASWRLAAGAQAAICGPSGSGKSTLLLLLAGIESAGGGVIRWDATRLDSLAPRKREAWRRRELGMVFQQFHLFPGLTALDNVLLPSMFAAPRATREERSHALELLACVSVPPGAATGTLSRGEQQRVAIARALARRPRVVLADEPTASLDPAAAHRAGEHLQRLCRESGATLVVATHDRDLAARLDRVYELCDGRLVEARPARSTAHGALMPRAAAR